MKWITPNNTFLIERNMKPLTFLTGSLYLGDQEYTESATYFEIDREGRVIKKYSEAIPFSIDYEMTISSIHLVIDDTLYKFYWSQIFKDNATQMIEKLLSNLIFYDGTLPFDVERVIHQYEKE